MPLNCFHLFDFPPSLFFDFKTQHAFWKLYMKDTETSFFPLLQAQAVACFAFKVTLQFRSSEHKLENNLNLKSNPNTSELSC